MKSLDQKTANILEVFESITPFPVERNLEPNQFYLVYRHYNERVLLGIIKYRVFDFDAKFLVWYFFDPSRAVIPANSTSTVGATDLITYEKIEPRDFPLYAYLTATPLGEQWYKRQQPQPVWKRWLSSIFRTG